MNEKFLDSLEGWTWRLFYVGAGMVLVRVLIALIQVWGNA